MNAFVLILYLSTGSVQSGMTVTTAQFETATACAAALDSAKHEFGGWATTVRGVCAFTGHLPTAPVSR